MTMTRTNYEEINQTLRTTVREAGAFMVGARGESNLAQTDKSNRKDFVTVADIKSQNIIIERLQQAYPDIVVLSEEHPEEQRAKMFAPDFTGFIIDPIDGTYSFKRDMRESTISVGYIQQGEIKTGVAYDPYKDELYSAVLGQGATRNNQLIHVSGQQGIEGASIATSNSYDDAAMARNLKRQLAIYEQSGTMPWMSCPGSGVLILAYVACGRFDAYHHNGLKPWDNAAAFLIVREAGGVVHTLVGQQASYTDSAIIAGNPRLVQTLEQLLAQADPALLT